MHGAILNLVLCIVTVGVSVGCSEEIPATLPEIQTQALLTVDGVLINPETKKPYDGWMVEYYPDSENIKSRSLISNGGLNGVSKGFYPDGHIEVEERFIDGVSNGIRRRFHVAGNLASEESIVDGLLHGLTRKWHVNGKLSEEIHFNKGKAHGQALAWHDDGSMKAQVQMEHGKVVEQEFWEPGEKLQFQEEQSH